YTIGAPTSGAPSSPQAAGEHPHPSSSDRPIRPDQIDGDEATSADRHKPIEELADPASAGFISSNLHSSSSSVQHQMASERLPQIDCRTDAEVGHHHAPATVRNQRLAPTSSAQLLHTPTSAAGS
ncbi:hypothetical protein ACLOJK_041713, partial [Asimina triloba]